MLFRSCSTAELIKQGNIPCSSAGEAQEGSHLSPTRVGFPILFSLGDVSTDVFQSVTPKAGFEPATSRLTVGGSATELLGIALFSLEFEIQCIVSITHFSKNFMVFSKTKILSVCTCSFHLTDKKKDFNWFHSASREEALSRI